MFAGRTTENNFGKKKEEEQGTFNPATWDISKPRRGKTHSLEKKKKGGPLRGGGQGHSCVCAAQACTKKEGARAGNVSTLRARKKRQSAKKKRGLSQALVS